METQIRDHSGLHPGLHILLGVILIIGGLAAMASPVIATLAVAKLLGWILVFGGIFRLAGSLFSGSWGGFFWTLLVGALYLIGGIALVRFPLGGAFTLALIVAMVFLVEGILEIGLGMQMRPLKGSGWTIFGGVLGVLVGTMLLFGFPSGSVAVVGLLFGINLVFAGVSTIMVALAARAAPGAATMAAAA